WDALQVVLAGLLFIQVWRLHGLLGLTLPGLAISSTIVAALLVVLDREPRRRLSRLNQPVVAVGWGLAVWVALSIPGSLYPGLSFDFLMKGFVRNVILMVLLAASVRALADLRRLAWLQVIGAALCSAAIVARARLGGEGRLSTDAYFDANDLATVIVCTLPFVLYLWRRPTGLWGRLALG